MPRSDTAHIMVELGVPPRAEGARICAGCSLGAPGGESKPLRQKGQSSNTRDAWPVRWHNGRVTIGVDPEEIMFCDAGAFDEWLAR